MDRISKKVRSKIMSRIRSVSKVEKAALHHTQQRAGCRLNHQPKGIYGNPDYANKGQMVAVFIQGCFWHQPCPKNCCTIPATRTDFWRAKFTRNALRHSEVVSHLKLIGWRVITIWEHDLKRGRTSR